MSKQVLVVFAVAIAVVGFLVFSSLSDPEAPIDHRVRSDAWLSDRIAHMAVQRNRPDKAAIVKSMDRFYRRAEADGVPGISQQDLELSFQLRQASQRRMFLESYWLPFDLNADLVVTRSEIEIATRIHALQRFNRDDIAPTHEQFSQAHEAAMGRVLRALGEDTDRLDVSEVSEIAQRTIEKSFWYKRMQEYLRKLEWLSLDRNGDESVSREEFDAAVSTAISNLDKNGDGEFDESELAATKIGGELPDCRKLKNGAKLNAANASSAGAINCIRRTLP